MSAQNSHAPEWRLVTTINPVRCGVCGAFAQTTWTLFQTPARIAGAVCEPCLAEDLEARP